MTDKPEIADLIARTIEDLVGADRGSVERTKPLMGQHQIDSLDLIEIAMALEDKFFPDDTRMKLDPQPDWTVDKFADLVMAKLSAKEGAPQT